MPAPQSSMMKQFARVKFSSNSLRVPEAWSDPQGDPAAKQYSDAFTASEKSTSPAMVTPPLFTAASMNKYHTDVQKMLTSKFGAFIDGITAAICSAWGQWQKSATMAGLVVTGPAVTLGMFAPIPITPLILASAPKSSPAELKYSQTVATVVGTAWATYTASIKVVAPGAFPSYAANPPGPAVPVPNVPIMLSSCIQVPAGMMAAALESQMIGMHGDPKAQYHKELFGAIADGVGQCFTTWMSSTTFNNLKVIGANPSPVTPGPVVGTAILPPGGVT
jgi:hypothetical protein